MQKGDRRAAEEIFDHFNGQLFGFFIKRTLNKDISEDLTQEVFLRIIGRIETYDPKSGHFSVWMWQIAKNKLIDHYRKQKEAYLSEMPDQDFSQTSELEKIEARIIWKDVERILEEFSQEERRIFSLRQVSGISYKEIGELTGKSPGSLRILVHRMNNKIRQTLK